MLFAAIEIQWTNFQQPPGHSSCPGDPTPPRRHNAIKATITPLVELTPFDRDGLAATSRCSVTWPLLAPFAIPLLAMVLII